jgi:hypothetical protein
MQLFRRGNRNLTIAQIKAEKNSNDTIQEVEPVETDGTLPENTEVEPVKKTRKSKKQ